MAEVLKLTTETTSRRGIAVAKNGIVFQFYLDRTPRWNVGLRRLVSELTGNIVGINPVSRGQTLCQNWSDFYRWVEDQSKLIESSENAPRADKLPEDWL